MQITRLLVVTSLFSFCGLTTAALACGSLLLGEQRYEWIRTVGLQPTKDWGEFKAKTGYEVVERNSDGSPREVKLKVLSDNPQNEIYVIGPFNKWGKELNESHRLRAADEHGLYFEGTIKGLEHGMEYRLRLNGKSVIDPSANKFTTGEYLNSIFYDLTWNNRPGAVKEVVPPPDLRTKPLAVAETEVLALVEKWATAEGKKLEKVEDVYKFIAESKVVDELALMGYNAVEFLPFNASLDGSNWAFRYQVFGLFAPEARYGSPDAFRGMVNAFHRKGIAVVMDAVVGHYPYRGNQGKRALDAAGLHVWQKKDGGSLFGNNESPWATNRYDYSNPHVRRFLIDSILHMFKEYGIGGIRFDNLDGIRSERGGDLFLRELMTEIRAYRPEAVLIGEMFFGESNVMRRLDEGGLGVNMRTHSDLFDFFKDFGQKSTNEIDMNRLYWAIRNPWLWREAPRISYLTNHDEAANPRDGMTGRYPASLLEGGGDYFVQKKTQVFGSLAMTVGGAYLDLPQMRLMQRGSFSNNPAIDWGRRWGQTEGQNNRFFIDMTNYYTKESAFAFVNYSPRIENHTDYGSKVISLRRYDRTTNKLVYVLLNLSHQSFDNYRFGVEQQRNYRVAMTNGESKYGGDNKIQNGTKIPSSGEGMHGQDASVTVPHVPAYGVVVIESTL